VSKRVLIDVDPVLSPPITGIGVYTGELISHFCSRETNDFECGYYYNRTRGAHVQYLDYLASKVAPDRMKDGFDHGLGHRSGVNYAWAPLWLDPHIDRWGSRWTDFQTRIQIRLSSEKWRVFHGTNYWLPPLPPAVKGIVTVHDLAYLRLPHTLTSSYFRQRWIERMGQSISRAECVIAISQATANDLQEFYKVDPRKIRVVYYGIDQREIEWIDPAEKPKLRQRWNLPERFLLFVGTLNIRKNILNAIKAFLTLDDPDLGFAIVGSPDNQHAEIEAFLRDCPQRDRIRMFGYLDRADVETLYQLATAFAFPSLYEGFGLPMLEAMRRRLPVVAGDNSSLRELFHDTAVMVDPLDINDIGRGMKQVVGDDCIRAALIEKGERKARTFTWPKAAEQTMEVYRSLL
jgi:glycosyltransferase involved in cell wall biosynthesis